MASQGTQECQECPHHHHHSQTFQEQSRILRKKFLTSRTSSRMEIRVHSTSQYLSTYRYVQSSPWGGTNSSQTVPSCEKQLAKQVPDVLGDVVLACYKASEFRFHDTQTSASVSSWVTGACFITSSKVCSLHHSPSDRINNCSNQYNALWWHGYFDQ